MKYKALLLKDSFDHEIILIYHDVSFKIKSNPNPSNEKMNKLILRKNRDLLSCH